MARRPDDIPTRVFDWGTIKWLVADDVGDEAGITVPQLSLAWVLHNPNVSAALVGASRPEDYVAFMRYAMRSSLRGRSTGRGLGFRCAAPARQRAPSGEPK